MARAATGAIAWSSLPLRLVRRYARPELPFAAPATGTKEAPCVRD